MAQDLSDLTQWASGLLASLSDAQRKTLAGQIAQDLRRANQSRIQAQTDPEGQAFTPRKPQLRERTQPDPKRPSPRARPRPRQMFAKLRLAKHLQTQTSPAASVVAFASAVQRIAQVHHHGLKDRIINRANAPEVQYAARPLIGINAQDTQRITDLILQHLSQG